MARLRVPPAHYDISDIKEFSVMKYERKILRLVEEAATLFEADKQRFSWQTEEYMEEFSAVVSIEKKYGNYVRFRSFSVQNFYPRPTRYTRCLAFVVCHPELTARHLFESFNINNNFGVYEDDAQFLMEWVETQRANKAVFRSVRGEVSTASLLNSS